MARSTRIKTYSGKQAYAGSRGGKIGGNSRARTLSSAQRSQIARKGGAAKAKAS